jgi:hypothetical protein
MIVFGVLVLGGAAFLFVWITRSRRPAELVRRVCPQCGTANVSSNLTRPPTTCMNCGTPLPPG